MAYIYNKYVLNTLVFIQLLLKVLQDIVVFELYYLGIYWVSVDGSFDFKSMASTYIAFVFIFIFSNIMKSAFNKNLIGIFKNLFTFMFVAVIFEKSNHFLTSINANQNVLTYIFEVLVVIGIISLLFKFILNKMVNNVTFNYYVNHSDDFRLIEHKFTYDVDGNEIIDYEYFYMKGFNPFDITYIK